MRQQDHQAFFQSLLLSLEYFRSLSFHTIFQLPESKWFCVSLASLSSKEFASKSDPIDSGVTLSVECEYIGVGAAVALGEGFIRGGGGGSIDGGGLAPASWRLGGAVGSVPDGKGAAVVEDGKPTRRVNRFPAPGYEKKSWLDRSHCNIFIENLGCSWIVREQGWVIPGSVKVARCKRLQGRWGWICHISSANFFSPSELCLSLFLFFSLPQIFASPLDQLAERAAR